MNKTVLLYSLFTGVILFVLFPALMSARTGSLNATLDQMNSRCFSISPKRIELSDQKPGTTTTAVFHLQNLSRDEIAIVGAHSGCSCTFVENIPVIAEPNKTVDIQVQIDLPDNKTVFQQSVLFIIETGKRTQAVPVEVIANINEDLSQ